MCVCVCVCITVCVHLCVGGGWGEGEREMGGEQARTVEVGGSNSKKTEQ